MEIARIYNGEIEIYRQNKPIILENGDVVTPSIYTTFEDLQQYGFMEIVKPIITDSQTYGEPIINGDIIEYSVIDKHILPIFFNWELAETGLATAFRNKFFDPRIDKYILSRNLQKQDFSILKSYLFGLKAQAIINEEDYERVKDLLLEQNINLDDYEIKF